MKSGMVYDGNLLEELIYPILIFLINIYLLKMSEFSSEIFSIFSIPSVIFTYWYNANAFTNFHVSDNHFSILKRYSVFRRFNIIDKKDIIFIELSNKKLMKWGHPIIKIEQVNGKLMTYHALSLSNEVFNSMISELKDKGYICKVSC